MKQAAVLVFGTIALSIALQAIVAVPAMWLWNVCLVDAFTGLREVTWLQMWGIMILCSMLFKTHVTTTGTGK